MAPTARTKRDRRVAARTRATTEPSWPRPVATVEPPHADRIDDDNGDRGQPDGLAAVIPLAIFDAREEAKKRW
jgi:putative transposase